MAGTATASTPLLQFGEQAVAMELFAVAAQRRPQSQEERELANGLLRHARGIQAIAEKWQHLTH